MDVKPLKYPNIVVEIPFRVDENVNVDVSHVLTMDVLLGGPEINYISVVFVFNVVMDEVLLVN